MQRLGLEWLFRLAQEPRRLLKRYAKTNVQFLVLLAREVIAVRFALGETHA
jgi:N-acetylglucosaminyldiphosphoundecaprenol N-acetyl-beta-D-mannosaminyltransferase